MRKPFIAGNWKMYKTPVEAAGFVRELIDSLKDVSGVDVAVCPPFPALWPVKEALEGSNIALGAQNMHFEKEGAFTGEVSPAMLQDIGVKYVILGHSERRAYFGETDELINQKIKAAFTWGLNPIFCVGETLEERERGITKAVVEIQVLKGLAGVTAEQAENLTIAYEPVWAIGTGKTATPDDAQEVCQFIRELLVKLFGREIADKVRIQYGGSVKPENIKELIAKPDIDGALVGGASLKVESFTAIVKGSI
ncbi:triose-phosphate isomerase [Carboxydothermus hydrogenoformans]|uniref:Triosephosphate isomerase n=1 Tax=Carboxydothermus hydrogenoformans (strain ATCC BAA-161 / DSM 6008 / Z-2901) TaxID=246194 RepID=TPIS_CARHZ|nr:triose-phosphate isomerase [Carboxydothermus hydrogenoformans]Q3AFD0.1 RecName: Full=Triosephosphate isomerase; Short=TIM; Short=TPI; AltName: Full=Triose-phosphate isomerase [Carboxydothermus hydrogenoformans Z-2901]ABB15245.1 triosephosphate isomerase [Carboxydothermus hydrogenoformans Z-2901]